MKTSLKIIILSLMITLAGCEKERLENRLEGTWELRHLNGTFLAPGKLGDYPPGNGDIYKFNGNDFEHQVGGKITDSGTYSVVKEDSNHNGETIKFKLLLKGNNEMSIPFELSENELILTYGSLASDGAISTYSRL